MAVSYVSTPAVSPTRVSFSYPAVIVVDSTVYGTANVTQHRFRLEVLDGATKMIDMYAVVDDETNKEGRFDISEIVKAIIQISNKTGSLDITKIPDVAALEYDQPETIVVNLYEQYYLSGVWTENSGGSRTFEAVRGYTDQANNEFEYENFWRLFGYENILPFSGKSKIVWPIRTDGSGWVASGTNRYLHILLTARPSGTVAFNSYIDRQDAALKPVNYIPLYSMESTADTFEYYDLELISAPTTTYPVVGGTTEESYKIYKTIEECPDEEIVIMFLDRFYQWSFMSFSKKHRITTTVESQKAELIPTADNPGRYRYNVEGSDILTVNTDFLSEMQNEYMRDLIQSERMYLVDTSDGTLEQVRIIPESITYRTVRNDMLQIQYTMQFRKSLDNFIP